jgi:hypothetical protein
VTIERFTLTEQHLAIIRGANIWWCDMETGAPGLDPKKPYGNGDVARDVARLIGTTMPDPDEFGREHDIVAAGMMTLHRDMGTVLEIVCQHAGQAVAPGLYARQWPRRKWERVQ